MTYMLLLNCALKLVEEITEHMLEREDSGRHVHNMRGNVLFTTEIPKTKIKISFIET